MIMRRWILVAATIAALWATLWILGLLSPLLTHRNFNEAQPVPGNEFPMDLSSKGHWQVLNQT
jgi:hypothetical protein